MNAFLYITLPTMGISALRRCLPLMVVGSLLWACDDDNQAPFATVDRLATAKVMTEKSREVYDAEAYFRDPDQDPLSFSASIDDATIATAELEEADGSLRLVYWGHDRGRDDGCIDGYGSARWGGPGFGDGGGRRAGAVVA